MRLPKQPKTCNLHRLASGAEALTPGLLQLEPSFQQVDNARFYYEHVLAKPWPAPGLVKPPRSQRLPDIVTVAEMQRLISATRVLSYRVLFFTLYSLGLRLGEGLRLEVGDIDGARGRVHIRNAKGNKDRFVPLPKATYSLLQSYWQVHRNPVLLFPSRAGGVAGGACATTPLDRGGVAAWRPRCIKSLPAAV